MQKADRAVVQCHRELVPTPHPANRHGHGPKPIRAWQLRFAGSWPGYRTYVAVGAMFSLKIVLPDSKKATDLSTDLNLVPFFRIEGPYMSF